MGEPKRNAMTDTISDQDVRTHLPFWRQKLLQLLEESARSELATSELSVDKASEHDSKVSPENEHRGREAESRSARAN